MNGSNTRRLNNGRYTRTFKIAPTTRAIRAALAVTATMLALGGSGFASATAPVCTTVGTTTTCSGDFITPVTDISVVDLTLVMSPGSTITPLVGLDGIYASSLGSATVSSYADITSTAFAGIQVYGATAASLTNYGAVYNTGVDAVQIRSGGDVTLVNSGTLSDTNTAGGSAYGVYAESFGGNNDINNTGTI